MSNIQSKITRYTKRQENRTHNRDKKLIKINQKWHRHYSDQIKTLKLYIKYSKS